METTSFAVPSKRWEIVGSACSVGEALRRKIGVVFTIRHFGRIAFSALSFLFVIIVPLVSIDEQKFSLIQTTLSVQLSLTAYNRIPWFKTKLARRGDRYFCAIRYSVQASPHVRFHKEAARHPVLSGSDPSSA